MGEECGPSQRKDEGESEPEEPSVMTKGNEDRRDGSFRGHFDRGEKAGEIWEHAESERSQRDPAEAAAVTIAAVGPIKILNHEHPPSMDEVISDHDSAARA